MHILPRQMTIPLIVQHSLNSQIKKWATIGRDDKDCMYEMKQLLRREIDRGRITHLEHVVRMDSTCAILDSTIEVNDTEEPAIVYAIRTVPNGEFISSLVRLGMCVHATTTGSRTCVQVAVVSEVRYSVLKHLLFGLRCRLKAEHFHMLLNHQDSDGLTALQRAFSTARCYKYCVLLIRAGALPNIGCVKIPTLHHAVSCGNRRLVRLLLDNCVDLNATDFEGKSALFHTGDLSMFRMLLRYGIDTGVRDVRGQTILDHLVTEVGENRVTPMLALKIVKMLDSFDGIHHISTTLSFSCPLYIRSKLLWIKLRRIVRGQMLHFVTTSSRAELARCIAYCEISSPVGYRTPTIRSMRNLLRRYTFCATDDAQNAVNENTLLQSPVSEVPAEFGYVVRNETNAYFFDIRELVKVNTNPYTNEQFSPEQLEEFRSRLRKIRFLRETTLISRLDDLSCIDMDSGEADEQLKIDELHNTLPSLPCNFFDAGFTRFRADATASLVQNTLGVSEEFTLLCEYMEEDPRLDDEDWRRTFIIDMLFEIIQESRYTATSLNVAIDDVATMETNIQMLTEIGVVQRNTLIEITPIQEAGILQTAKALSYSYLTDTARHFDADGALNKHSNETNRYAKKSQFCSAICDFLYKDQMCARRRSLCILLFRDLYTQC